MQVNSSWPRKPLNDRARANFDSRAKDLASLIVKRTFEPSREDTFPTRHMPALTITLDSSPDDWTAEITDFFGRTKGRYYLNEGHEFALVDDAYKKLNLFSTDITRTPPFNDGFKLSFIEKAVFRWIKFFGINDEVEPFSKYLLDECAAQFKPHRIIIPLEFIEIEQDFMLGNVLVRTMPKSLIDHTEKYVEELHGPKSGRSDEYNKIRKQFANQTAIEVTVEGEPEYAQERAWEIAFDISDVLRFLSPASASSVLPSLIQPMGYGHIPSLNSLIVTDEYIQSINTKHMYFHLARWQQSQNDLNNAINSYLSELHIFFDGSNLSDYAARFRRAFRVYCRALGRFESQDRIVGVISALECLFIDGSSDPLQHTVSERMAFMTTETITQRRHVVKIYKKAYGLRSGIVHHSESFNDEATADELFLYAKVAFRRGIRALSHFKSHKQFLKALDDVKFGGHPPTSIPHSTN